MGITINERQSTIDIHYRQNTRVGEQFQFINENCCRLTFVSFGRQGITPNHIRKVQINSPSIHRSSWRRRAPSLPLPLRTTEFCWSRTSSSCTCNSSAQSDSTVHIRWESRWNLRLGKLHRSQTALLDIILALDSSVLIRPSLRTALSVRSFAGRATGWHSTRCHGLPFLCDSQLIEQRRWGLPGILICPAVQGRWAWLQGDWCTTQSEVQEALLG